MGLFSMERRWTGMPDMRVGIGNLRMKNPVCAASGTFGFGREYHRVFDISRIGGVMVKGLTLAPRAGNPAPRVVETRGGMMNSVGLQNPGVDAFISEELPWLRTIDVAVIANISGNTLEVSVDKDRYRFPATQKPHVPAS